MPFQSEKQRRYMHANLPRIAKRWERDYANGGIIALAQGGRIGFYKGSDRHGGTGGRTSSGMDMSGATNVGGTTGSGLGGGPHGGGEWSGPTYSPPKTKTFTGPNIYGEGIGSQTFDINKRNIALQDQYRQGASQRAHPFLSKVKSGIGNIFHGLGNKIFQGRGNYENQAAWEQARQDRINKKSINRLRKTRDYGKYANDPQGWAGSDLSGRLTGLEKDVFGKDYVDYSRTTPKARDLKALRDREALTSQLSTNDYKPQGFMENLQSKFGSEVRPAAALSQEKILGTKWANTPIQWDDITPGRVVGSQKVFDRLKADPTINTWGDLYQAGLSGQIEDIGGAQIMTRNPEGLAALGKEMPYGMELGKQGSWGDLEVEDLYERIPGAGASKYHVNVPLIGEEKTRGTFGLTGRGKGDFLQKDVEEKLRAAGWLSQGGRVGYGAGGIASLWPR